MAMDEVQLVARLGDAGMCLEISDPQFDEQGHLRHLQARLHGTRLDAQLSFYVYEVAGLMRYFHWLDEDWRGWSGERQFESVFDSLVTRAIA